MSIDGKAFEAYKKNRELAPKYQVGDSMWMDWYRKGYHQAEKDFKQKAIETYKNTCSFSPVGCCMMKKEADECDCDNLKDFIEELNSQQ